MKKAHIVCDKAAGMTDTEITKRYIIPLLLTSTTNTPKLKITITSNINQGTCTNSWWVTYNMLSECLQPQIHMTLCTCRKSISWTLTQKPSKWGSEHVDLMVVYTVRSPCWLQLIKRSTWSGQKRMWLVCGRLAQCHLLRWVKIQSYWLGWAFLVLEETWARIWRALYKEGCEAWQQECDGLGVPDSQGFGLDLTRFFWWKMGLKFSQVWLCLTTSLSQIY